MGKRMIVHVICAVILAVAYYLFFDDAVIEHALLFAVVYLGISAMLDFMSDRMKAKKRTAQVATVDLARVKAFIEAIGGAENVTSTDSEVSRVKVVLQDVDLIDQDKLKALALDGAYLAGNQLQVTIGANSSEFSRQIQEAIK